MVKMNVAGLTIDPFTNMPIVILKDDEGKQAVPIWIGLVEASAIATELENIQLARPMTHDLLRNILTTLKVKVLRIEVNDLKSNTFYASIFLGLEGKVLEIDSRPSDAIALALRTKSRILVDEKVIEKSRQIDVQDKAGQAVDKEKWDEFLENLPDEHFGKWKM